MGENPVCHPTASLLPVPPFPFALSARFTNSLILQFTMLWRNTYHLTTYANILNNQYSYVDNKQNVHNESQLLVHDLIVFLLLARCFSGYHHGTETA